MSRETSRKDIERGKAKTDEEFAKIDAEFKKDVRTKKAIESAAKSAEVAGTDEGMRNVKAKVEQAGSETDQQFDQDDREQQKVVQNEAKPREDSLADRTKNSRADERTIGQAESQAEVASAKASLRESVKATQEDAEYTEGKGREQRQSRETAERNAQQKGTEVKQARVVFRH